MKHLIKHLDTELQEEMDLSKGLAHHIAMQDADDLNDSAEGFGTDEQKMGRVILQRLPENIALTEAVHREKYGKSLEEVVVGENEGFLTGLSHFGKFLAHRTRRPGKRDAILFNESMAGFGTSDKILVEMLSTRTNAELAEADEFYTEQYGQTLKDHILSETTGWGAGWYGKWMELLADMDCDEGTDVPEDVEDLAKQLYEAGAGKFMGIDEQVFLDILAKANQNTLNAIGEAYDAMDETERTLIEDIEKLFG